MSERPALPAAVLFDMDGTLLDTEVFWYRAQEDLAQELGFTWTALDQEHCLGGPLERVVDHLIARSSSTRAGDEVGEDLLGRVGSLMRDNPVRWRPGARDLLAQALDLRLPTALVTASDMGLVGTVHDRVAAEFGRSPFDALVTGEVVPHGKPHPAPYLMAADQLGVDPVACLAIEDSPTGARSAWAAGCRVVAVPHISPIPNEVAAHQVDSLVGCSIEGLWAAARGRRDVSED